MPEYRGNVGNLLQHWVLCEILAACRDHVRHVAFIDAHSMAPFARQRHEFDITSHLFDHVRDRLPGESSFYEESWYTLDPDAKSGGGYPNSASFLAALWADYYSLILCETDLLTVQDLRRWTDEVRRSSPKCLCAEVFHGKWDVRFTQGLPASGELAFFSFDPYMFNRNVVKDPKPGNMYPSDLNCVATAVQSISQGIIVQLSTYSVNNANSQEAVIESVRSGLKAAGLDIVATVRANGTSNGLPWQMMSIVLGRGIAWADSLRTLESRFELWLKRAIDEHRVLSR